MEKKYSFDYESYAGLSGLSAQDADLVRCARKACGTAYAPYSGFKVGAAVRLASGRVLTAGNQESEVFPAGMCAERSLLYYCMSNFGDDPVSAIAIASVPGEKECYPCGMCRQVMVDAEKRQGTPIRVIMSGKDSATVVDTSVKLLPFAFEL